MRQYSVKLHSSKGGFQSTHSLRSATPGKQRYPASRLVSIHALLAECDRGRRASLTWIRCFNPRTPCGVRHVSGDSMHITPRFQSTHSLRSATKNSMASGGIDPVSIHALLAECDSIARPGPSARTGFNPRTPCGVRRNRLYTLLLNRANHTLRQPP